MTGQIMTNRVGILAYGSVIACPGPEIAPLIARKISVRTPFPVEFAKYSRKRCGAATVTPSPLGASVETKVLVLKEGVSVKDAKDLLWKRETDQMGSDKSYSENRSRKAVRVRTISGLAGVGTVVYTDFYAGAKIRNPNPNPKNLAIRANRSVKVSIAKRKPGKDGISYLIKVKKSGVITPLTDEYEKEIL